VDDDVGLLDEPSTDVVIRVILEIEGDAPFPPIQPREVL
jgi:hypothetical protein